VEDHQQEEEDHQEEDVLISHSPNGMATAVITMTVVETIVPITAKEEVIQDMNQMKIDECHELQALEIKNFHLWEVESKIPKRKPTLHGLLSAVIPNQKQTLDQCGLATNRLQKLLQSTHKTTNQQMTTQMLLIQYQTPIHLQKRMILLLMQSISSIFQMKKNKIQDGQMLSQLMITKMEIVLQ